jgi:hypothetical protein
VITMKDPKPPTEAAQKIAEKLMTAASHGENLMREIDFLSTPVPGQPSKIDVLKGMVDLKTMGKFGGVEILDGQGKPITNERGAFNVQKIVRKDGATEQTLYESGVGSEGRALYNQDQHNVLLEDKVEAAHKGDANKIVQTFQKAVDEMVKSGHRVDGEGALMGLVNNVDRAYFDDKKYDCADQAVQVLKALKQLNLNGHWDFHLVGDPPHYTVETVSHNPNDPIIHLDPWRGRNAIEIKPPGKGISDKRLNQWLDDQGHLHWS